MIPFSLKWQKRECSIRHIYRPHPLEAKVKPLGVHLRVAEKRMKTALGKKNDTYQGSIHVGGRVGSFHNGRPIHHEPVNLRQRGKCPWVTLGSLRVHSGRPDCLGCW